MSRKRLNVSEALQKICNDESDSDDIDEFDSLITAAEVAGATDETADVVILPPSTVDEEVVDEDDLLPSDLPNDVPGYVAVFVHPHAPDTAVCLHVPRRLNVAYQGSQSGRTRLCTPVRYQRQTLTVYVTRSRN